MISGKTEAWRIDLSALEWGGGDGDGGFIGLSIANLSASVRYRTIWTHQAGQTFRLHFFSKALGTQSPARHRSLHCSRVHSPLPLAICICRSVPTCCVINQKQTARDTSIGAAYGSINLITKTHAGDMAWDGMGANKYVLSTNIVTARDQSLRHK